jgi:hypothetical protein
MWLLFVSALIAQPPKQESPKEDWFYLENAEIRVGLLRSHGGAVAHLSLAGSDVNLLNHYDHGRLIQQSYYGDEDGSRWVDKPWRFNPVQGGDYRGNASQLVEFKATETSVYCKTIPRNWASGDLVNDCQMEQWLELQGPILEVRYKLHYQGQKMHQARHQETPAIFVSSKLKNLVTYSGDQPWTAASLTTRVPGWPNEYLVLSENWAAYVDDNGAGVGVYVPGANEATCYRFQGGSGSDCSYIAPLHSFALTPGLTFTYTAFFTAGDKEAIRRRFTALHSQTQSPTLP